MVVSLILWEPKSVFDTSFNKIVAYVTRGSFCHAEVLFKFTKQEWKKQLLAFDKNYGIIGTRAKSLWARIDAISEGVSDSEELALCFYTIWGSRLSVRLLNEYDDYIFNRLPDKEFTKTLSMSFSAEEIRHCLAFSIQELEKAYDSYKALTYFLPPALIRRPVTPALPNKYFCSEFICYMFHQLGYLKDTVPEKVTPNHLPALYDILEEQLKLKHG